MKIFLLCLPLAFLVLASGAIGADEEKFVIGIKGMT